MPRATCRCGHILEIPDDGRERVVCPKCSAKIRVRRKGVRLDDGDGFLRFSCPCGRRLKVKIDPDVGPPEAGRCPDCGRTVPIPSRASSSEALSTGHPEAATEELSEADMAMLNAWSQRRRAQAAAPAEATTGQHTVSTPDPSPPPSTMKIEAGLRVCPRCGKPVHLSAVVCRECGAHVPKR
jgi:DNA-directed RNA polymerase subunit M/transcription elongation factor TFIIS